MTSLASAVVLVTGANGGLGTEFVRQALDRGAAKVYASARSPREWDDPRVVPLALDVTDAASVAAAAETARDVTVLVNNAGIASVQPSLLETTDEEFRRLIETNVIGLHAITRALAPAIRRTHGAVLNVASVASWRARGALAAYGATKAAVWSMTDALRGELAPDGVQVVGLYLGFTDTPMTAGMDVPKGDPADVVREAYDGLEQGGLEVLADDVTRQVRSGLSRVLTAS
ncbi:SDR family oxidoreductase [Amnibacterium setariae]|uniref:SDR family NAD(P)-dependent oxidoreductase n=1 Tax=Amnibacterium setariae TaxID=2306585 RepID=A0A3A1TYN6_9MICO|nr:SDR family oxidoreductase [Amnibacterium setariae]RIX27785.1 SDR family NAD(P)-dependent oxidoreductase [Amnibacterium setariae]